MLNFLERKKKQPQTQARKDLSRSSSKELTYFLGMYVSLRDLQVVILSVWSICAFGPFPPIAVDGGLWSCSLFHCLLTGEPVTQYSLFGPQSFTAPFLVFLLFATFGLKFPFSLGHQWPSLLLGAVEEGHNCKDSLLEVYQLELQESLDL